jgi:hypothetical protein
MRSALQALNKIVADGVLESYAIGGAIGAAFYVEAVQTQDIDVFVFLRPTGGLLTLSPIYEALKAQGGVIEKEYVRFDKWPVQILPDVNDLVAEAIREARAVAFDGTPTRVFTAEHLCGIALQTGRPKDYLRVRAFFEQNKVDREILSRLVERHGLAEQLRHAEDDG